MEIRNVNGETPRDVAKRFAQLGAVQLLGGDDSESEHTDYSDDEDIPLKGNGSFDCIYVYIDIFSCTMLHIIPVMF